MFKLNIPNSYNQLCFATIFFNYWKINARIFIKTACFFFRLSGSEMHFRIIVALVTREYISYELELPLMDVTMSEVTAFMDALNGVYSNFVKCILHAIFGRQADNNAKMLVTSWLRNPKHIEQVFILFLNNLYTFILY